MKKLLIAAGFLLVLFLAAFRFYLYPRLQILNGHAAKTLCSCIFVAGIPEEKAISEDIGFFPVSLATKKVNHEEKSVTADFWGFRPKKAYYRPGLGCAIFNHSEPKTEGIALGFNTSDTLKRWFDYVDTVQIISDQQSADIQKALDWAFEEEDPTNPKLITRAAAVVYKGQLIGEKYAKGFDKNSRLLGWSMTKSITAVLYGILERNGMIQLDDSMKMNEWKGSAKEALTIRHLLNMSSGMKWSENYADRSSVTIMLYESDSLGKKASSAPIAYQPGEKWYYSSGTSNILSHALAHYFEDQLSYQKFPYESLFARLGMSSMQLEADAGGYFVGSSYSWASARDWAKFGLMLMNKGVFAEDTIVNTSWVDFMTTPVPDSEGKYGGQVWLNASGQLPDVPADAFYPNGFHGQRILIVPSKELVIVRLGETYYEPNFDFNEWAKMIIQALEI